MFPRWLKCYYPDVFAAALLNSQPMGFYQPAQIVIDAQKHGVVVRPVDINHSFWDYTLEEKTGAYCALRLGFRQVKGLREEDMQLLVNAREAVFKDIVSVMDAGVTLFSLERLADADAFRSIGLDRRQALWEVSALSDRPIGMFTGLPSESSVEEKVQLPAMTLAEHVVQDYGTTALSLKAHPVGFVREKLDRLKVTALKDLSKIKNGALVKVAGLVLVRQRPGTAKGICFITIEDEASFANLVVFQALFDRYRKEILRSRLLMVEGRLQREGEVVHVIVRKCHDLSVLLGEMAVTDKEQDGLLTLSHADEKDGGAFGTRDTRVQQKPVQMEIFPSGRNFK